MSAMPECRQVFYWWHFAANLSFDAWNASSLSPFSSSTLFVWTLCELQRWTTTLFLFMFHWSFFVVALRGLDLTFKCMKEFFDQTNTVPPSWQSVILNNYCRPQRPLSPPSNIIWQVERKLNISKVTMHYLLLPHISTTSPPALSPLPSHSPLFTPAPHLPNSLTCISVNSCSPWPSCVRHGCACVRCA